ncbi:MAG TPA: hypothetical protein VFW98_08230 [Gemmatimonadaceae bacterium]|nr:hypothetical protein [Gemmatimonadaceae bacterium]
MSELYTSLTRLKQTMNGGQMPPMTPIPEAARKIIDPAFTPGLGALDEDAGRGLRCPVRDCGQYYHALGRHLAVAHKNIGGSAAVRRALDIPKTVPLLSGIAREHYARGHAAERARPRRHSMVGPKVAEKRVRSLRKSCGASRRSMASRNLRDRCDAQLRHKLIDCHHRLGRSPTMREAKAMLPKGTVKAAIRVYGTWRNVLAQCGLAVASRARVSRDDVLAGLYAWYKVRGGLPTLRDVKERDRVPLIHDRETIVKHIGGSGWAETMQIAAAVLGITGGRYGLQQQRVA